ncbi:acyl-CoA-binding protein [Flavobacterium caeni]|uniref:Acyl-CoA-binding protein n=1 Tax=Flavobacterium caeni TaxID=490189 RepID=A0A1G5CMU6_9FLAO|nr:acyl-CoA-binding protein [Flavobacterium caeni]SCY03591.1 Acyl-CoA-binding protein [Flavobacterium caeni]
MTEKDLDTRFKEAIEIADKMLQADLPQDVQLRLYAYYKKATSGTPTSSFNSNDLRNAFKTNAWIQINHLTIDEAKELYIQAIHELNK